MLSSSNSVLFFHHSVSALLISCPKFFVPSCFIILSEKQRFSCLFRAVWETSCCVVVSFLTFKHLMSEIVIDYWQSMAISRNIVSKELVLVPINLSLSCLKFASRGTAPPIPHFFTSFSSLVVWCQQHRQFINNHRSLAALIRCLQQIRISFHHVVAKFYGIWPSCSDAGTG